MTVIETMRKTYMDFFLYILFMWMKTVTNGTVDKRIATDY